MEEKKCNHRFGWRPPHTTPNTIRAFFLLTLLLPLSASTSSSSSCAPAVLFPFLAFLSFTIPFLIFLSHTSFYQSSSSLLNHGLPWKRNKKTRKLRRIIKRAKHALLEKCDATAECFLACGVCLSQHIYLKQNLSEEKKNQKEENVRRDDYAWWLVGERRAQCIGFSN